MTSQSLEWRPRLRNVTKSDIDLLKAYEFSDFNGKPFLDADFICATSPSETKVLDAGLRRFKNKIPGFLKVHGPGMSNFFTHKGSTTGRSYRAAKCSDFSIRKREGVRGMRDVTLRLNFGEPGCIEMPLFACFREGPRVSDVLADRPDPDTGLVWYAKLRELLLDSLNSAKYGDQRVIDTEALRLSMHRSFRAHHSKCYCGLEGSTFRFFPSSSSLSDLQKDFHVVAKEFIQCFNDHDWFDLNVLDVQHDDLQAVADKIVENLCGTADLFIKTVEVQGYKSSLRQSTDRMNQLAANLRKHEKTLESALSEVKKRSVMISQVADNKSSSVHAASTAGLFA